MANTHPKHATTHQPHPSGMSDGNYPSLAQPLVDDLRDLLQGTVIARSDKEFETRTRIFNGNVVTPAKAVVIPASTIDVSNILKFCTKHGLFPSIKAGGYGTAGWAINGDVVVDLSRLDDIAIEPPKEDGAGFVSLRDMPVKDAKGKAKAQGSNYSVARDVVGEEGEGEGEGNDVFAVGKRRRRSPEPDVSFDSGALPRDPLVAKFLQMTDLPSPSIRRRLDLLDPSFLPNPNANSSTSTPKVSLSLSTTPSEMDAESMEEGAVGAENMSRQSSSESSEKTGRTTSTDGYGSSFSASTSTSTAYTSPSTAPTSPGLKSTRGTSITGQSGGADANTLDVIASVSAGLYDQHAAAAAAVAHLRRDATHVDDTPSSNDSNTPTPTPTLTSIHQPAPVPERATQTRSSTTSSSRTPSSFSVRSEDPFGYMSAPPSAPPTVSSVRRPPPPRGFQQPAFQTPSAETETGSTSGGVRNRESGRASMLMDSTTDADADMQAVLLNISPRASFLSVPTTPVYPHAYVSFGAGVKQKDIDLYTAAHPLPATLANGNISSVAYHIPLAAHPVGSSVMLLGGFGFLSRLHGLSIDALVEVEMVLADGSIVYVNENEHPDLWWALRGAGPAFGVVTRYKAKAYPIPVVFAGNLIYNFHPSTAASLIKHFRDCVKAAPRELYANVLLTAGPADKGSLVVVQLCYVGGAGENKGRAILQAIESWEGETCLLNEVCEKSFLSQQDSVAQILRGKAGRQWYIRSALITSLPDEIIHKTVNEFADTPVGCTWLFELAGGAVSDADDTCFPKTQREAGFTIAAFHQWELDDDDPLCVTTAEHWIEKTLAPVSTGGPYPAFLGRHEPSTRIIGSFGTSWPRLAALKSQYDPSNLLRNSFWTLDESGGVVEPCVREPKSPVMRARDVGLGE